MYLLLQFFFGGLMVVGITTIAKFIDPKYSGIVYAIPVTLITAVTFVYLNQGLPATRSSLWSIFAYGFTLIIFSAVFALSLSRLGYWWGLVFALVIWFLSALVVFGVLK
jgi:hypothetical protein